MSDERETVDPMPDGGAPDEAPASYLTIQMESVNVTAAAPADENEPEPGGLGTEPAEPEQAAGRYLEIDNLEGESSDKPTTASSHTTGVAANNQTETLGTAATEGEAEDDPHEGWVEPQTGFALSGADSAAGDDAGPSVDSIADNFEEMKVTYTENDSKAPMEPVAVADPTGPDDDTSAGYVLQDVQITSVNINASGDDTAPPAGAGSDLPRGVAGTPIEGDWDGQGDDDVVLADLEPTGELTRSGVGGDGPELVDFGEAGGLDEVLDL